MITITGTKGDVNIEKEECAAKLSGELCAEYFSALWDTFQWVRYDGDEPDKDKVKLALEVMDYQNKEDHKFKICFCMYTTDELVGAMSLLPDLTGSLEKTDNSTVKWTLPNGIIVNISLNERVSRDGPKSSDWYVDIGYKPDGEEEMQLKNRWHPSADEVWSDMVDIYTGEFFWVISKNIFGKESLPRPMFRKEYNSKRDKSKFKVL